MFVTARVDLHVLVLILRPLLVRLVRHGATLAIIVVPPATVLAPELTILNKLDHAISATTACKEEVAAFIGSVIELCPARIMVERGLVELFLVGSYEHE